MTYWHRWTSYILGVFTPEVQDTPILWQYNFFLHEDKLCGLQQGTAVVPVYSFYFYRNMTSLVWLTAPPLLRQIYTYIQRRMWGEKERQKERGRTNEKTTFNLTPFPFYTVCDTGYQPFIVYNLSTTPWNISKYFTTLYATSNMFITALLHLLFLSSKIIL